MIRSFISVFSRRNLSNFKFARHNQKLQLYSKSFSSNTFNSTLLNELVSKNICFVFSTQSHQQAQNIHQNHRNQDQAIKIRRSLELLSKQVQQKHPNNPEEVIKELYTKCQTFIGENRQSEILILFELISNFVEAKNLMQKYSTFAIISARNSFQLGKYQEVQRKCKLALPFEVKKYGENHKTIGDIYNMLGISISKLQNGNGKQALQYLQKAFSIRKQLFGQNQLSAEILFNSGVIEEQNLKQLENAEKYYLDAIQILQNCGIPTPLLYLKAKMRLADLQFQLHNTISKYISDLLRIEKVIEKFKSEQKFTQTETDQVDMMLFFLQKDLGKSFMDTGDFHKAISYFEICLAFLRESQVQNQNRIYILEHCIASHAALNNFEQAAILLEEFIKILDNFPDSEEHKFNYLQYLSQIYQKYQAFDKELATLERARAFISNTKMELDEVEKMYQVQMSVLYCLGNLKKYDQVIPRGHSLITYLESKSNSFNSKQDLEDYKSNVYTFIGFGYQYKQDIDTALQYFEKSDKIFSSLPSNNKRVDLHLNVIRKLLQIQLQFKQDLKKAFQYLERFRKILVAHPSASDPKKLNDLVHLLLNHKITTSNYESQEEMMRKLTEVKFIDNINNIFAQIVKLCQKVSTTNHSKQVLKSYYFLIVTIHQMFLSFNKMKPYPGKQESIQRTKHLLTEMIQVYDKVFSIEIQQVKSNSFKEDETLAGFIKNVEQVKQDLSI